MAVALAIFGVACAAFAVWLTVRIVNRRERWAKRTAMWLALVPVLYFLSSGPAVWIYVHCLPKSFAPALSGNYSPFVVLVRSSPTFASVVAGYTYLWVSEDDQLKKFREP